MYFGLHFVLSRSAKLSDCCKLSVSTRASAFHPFWLVVATYAVAVIVVIVIVVVVVCPARSLLLA